ncbi:hypothetical protein SAMN05216515_10160 [Eubacterium pyruvativorans]|uniref:Uncharacterized protein n=1 Tax=Eubacterium pyruvativorans TaxID=155865 RepID=A0A1I7FFH3_9FIRM|nr:hypothetical protein [Eubacterium pyruvativorans]MCI5747544.1 hypothetical protein [Eubacterium pyruvativorans]MDD6708008.1 hypothetical protein [Eubacterium pyruvativorans]MDD7684886.1 hypothetical protein [Eubacterium pyruvativorans]MDY4049039.1 hypothetical protein [Eubacterium pyruvativorans]SDF07051.1 hypothetical protein SAMN04487889_10968 [Eubacterium pyruvativorans]
MKKSTIFTKLLHYIKDREFWKYTLQFLALLLVLYLFSLFSMGITSPVFTYAVF